MVYKRGGRRRGGLRKRRGGLRKRRMVRRRTDGGKIVAMRNTLVPDRMLIKLSYKDNINLAGVSPSAWSYHQFRMNSIYDPDMAVTDGHQPLGHDQWNVFYYKYRVYKAVVNVQFVNNTNAGVQLGLVPFNFDSPIINDDSIFEMPHAKTKVVGSAGGMNKCSLTKVIDIPRILGQSHVQYKTNPNTSAVFNGNPLNQCCLQVVARTINDSTAPLVQAIVNITYYCEFFDRINPRISTPPGKSADTAFQAPTGEWKDFAGSTMSYLQTLPFQYISTISSP